MPISTLRAALTYPDPEGTLPDDALRGALSAVGLELFVNRLDDDHAVLRWVEERCVKHSREAIEQWNEVMISRHPDTAVKKARFLHFLKEAGGEGRKDIRTYFDLIEFDEGRLK